MTHNDLITLALAEIRAARAGDVIAPDDLAFAQQIYNALLDELNADKRAIYAETFIEPTLTPMLSPHLIGPGGSGGAFVVAQRPVSIERASIGINTTSPTVYVPLNKRDYKWYARQPVPGITNALPRDFYYEEDWPNGALYLWGIPTTNYTMRIWLRILLAQIAVFTATFSLPPGYQNMLTLTLAERLAVPFGQQLSETTKTNARLARARVFDNNDDEPELMTADSGLPGGANQGGLGFNWLSRTTN